MGTTNTLDLNNRVDELAKSYPANKVMMSDGVTSVEDAVDELTSGLTDLTTAETVTLTAATGVTLENVSITKIGRVMIGSFKMTLSGDVAIYGEIATLSKVVSHKAVYPITNGGFCYTDDLGNTIRAWQGLNAGAYIVQLVAFVQ